MGLCDPKAVRKGKPWYQQVNEPGFMKPAQQEEKAKKEPKK